MVLASHRRTSSVFALAACALFVVHGCAKLKAQRQSAPPSRVAVVDEMPAAPTTQPTTDVAITSDAEPTTQTADATTQPSDPTTQTAEATTQPAEPVAEATPTTQPAADVTATAAPAPATRPADAPNAALAERFALMAQAALQTPVVVKPSWQTAAALLEAATRLQPQEPRFVRLLVEARTRGGDIPGAIEALAAYRRLVPSDQFAQVQQIDLYLTRMETADAKVKYLESLTAADGIAPEVRSHAAVRAAETLLERSQAQQAEAMVTKALELNPLNVAALRMRVTTVPPQTPEQRVAMIVSMIRATPGDPGVAARLARELGAAGLNRAALEWYASALQMYLRTNASPDAGFVTDYVAALFLSGSTNDAEQLLTQLLNSDPTNINGWTLRLVIARASGDKAKFDTAVRQANVALSNRLAMIRQAAGDKTATTQPIDAPGDVALPEPAPILQQVAATGRNDLGQLLAETASAAAWLKIYFENKPTEAVPWVGVLRQMYGEQSPIVARLEGWSFLGVDRADEARVKLSAVADRDPLAQLGLIKAADPASQQRADADARALLSQYPAGVLGALLSEALRDRNIQPEPAADAQAVARELEKFPKDFIRILDQPGLYYSVRLDPLKVAHAAGEPILVRVTLQNVGNDAITVGPDGAIKSDLWFDAQTRGIAQQPFPGVAYDRIAGPLVLHPGATTSQVVRLDQGNLSQVLDNNPVPMLQLSGVVTTNPTTTREGIAPGLAGVRETLSRLVQRTGSPLNEQTRQRITQSLGNGTAAEKVRTLALVAAFVNGLSGQGADDQAKSVAAQFRDLLRRATRDPEPSVSAWAGYLGVLVAPQPEKAALVNRLLEGDWMQRILAVSLVQSGETTLERAVVVATGDPDPLLRDYGAAVIEMVRVAATQPAATQPAGTTRPTTAPVTSSDSRPAP